MKPSLTTSGLSIFTSLVNIFIDTHTVITVVRATMTNSLCVQQCRERIAECNVIIRVAIYWVLGHKGGEWMVAKTEVNLPLRCTLCDPKLSKDRIHLEAKSLWEALTSCRTDKFMLGVYCVKTQLAWLLSYPHCKKLQT